MGVLTNQTFPLTRVSGLDGFSGVVGPVEHRDRYWLIASRESPSDGAAILSSQDGRDWVRESEIPAPAGKALRVDQLAVANDELMAAGTIGEVMGRPYWQFFPGSLTAWTSTDGRNWHSETIATYFTGADYWVSQLVANHSTTLVTGHAWPTPDLAVLEAVLQEIPLEFEPALIRGDLWLWPHDDELLIEVPPGLVVFSARLPSDWSWDQWPSQSGFLYRSVVGGWAEGEPPRVSRFRGVARIAVLPAGGFVSTNQTLRAVTSLGGANWQPEASLPVAHEYLNWGTRLVAKATFGSYQIDDGVGFVKVEPPEVMLGVGGELELVGTPAGLVTMTSVYGPPELAGEIVSGDYTVRLDGMTLSVMGGTTAERVYIPHAPLIPHRYDPVMDTVTVEALDQTFEFPIADLRKLAEGPPPRHEVFVSTDGANWSSTETEFVSGGVQILGGGTDFFLIASFDDARGGQVQSMTVYRAEPFT